jgi:hypothetical protein
MDRLKRIRTALFRLEIRRLQAEGTQGGDKAVDTSRMGQ